MKYTPLGVQVLECSPTLSSPTPIRINRIAPNGLAPLRKVNPSPHFLPTSDIKVPIDLIELINTARLLNGPLVVAVIDLSVVVHPVHRRPDRNDDPISPVAALVQQLCRFGNLEGIVVGHCSTGAMNLEFGRKFAGI